jgi:hypothetical protein
LIYVFKKASKRLELTLIKKHEKISSATIDYLQHLCFCTEQHD